MLRIVNDLISDIWQDRGVIQVVSNLPIKQSESRVRRVFLFCILGVCLTPISVFSEGDLTRRATRLDPVFIDANTGFSEKLFTLSTGQYYRWRFQGDGRDEYTVLIPDLFEHTWLERVVVEDVEIPIQTLSEFTLEGESEIDIFFIPIRQGSYEFYVEQLRSEGFNGEIVVN